MVKVLRKGNVENSIWKVKVQCSGRGNSGLGCGALLEATENDLRYFGGDWGYFERDSQVCVRCPDCGSVTDLKKDDWPKFAYHLQPWTKQWSKTGQNDTSTSQWRKWRKDVKGEILDDNPYS